VAVLRYNTQYTPPATLVAIGLNIAVAAGDIATGGLYERLLWARAIDVSYGQPWRVAGAGFAHADLLHLGMNCYGIWVLGVILERRLGWRVFCAVYVAALLAGNTLGLVFYDPATPMLGASGAAYGLFGAVLGFFLAKAGSLRGLAEIPMARHLLIWLLFGVWISLRPGISLLGHVGGFVPGALLGLYFELRYARRTDLYHHLAAAVLGLAVLAGAAWAAWPWPRGHHLAARALAAYENGDLARGDELLARARSRGLDGGGAKLARHLELWRQGNQANPRVFDLNVLRRPLTHPQGDETLRHRYWDFLDDESFAPVAGPGPVASPAPAH
jgi:membrane associated rhomboid family serine protease